MVVLKLRAWNRAQQNNSAVETANSAESGIICHTCGTPGQTKSIRTENSRNSNVEAVERGEVREIKAMVGAEAAAAKAKAAAILAVANEAEAGATRTSFATAKDILPKRLPTRQDFRYFSADAQGQVPSY
jgi:hypothetical protein